MTARLVVWLLRHPMAAVALVLAAIAATGFGAVLAFAPRPAAPRPPAASMGVAAESRLPAPTEFPPPGRVAAMHRALHAMGRACQQPVRHRDPQSVLKPVAVMEQFARDYPKGGFSIDDEAGTTLSLMVVLRNELQNCDPSLVAGVEKLLPPRFRDPESTTQ